MNLIRGYVKFDRDSLLLGWQRLYYYIDASVIVQIKTIPRANKINKILIAIYVECQLELNSKRRGLFFTIERQCALLQSLLVNYV